MAAISYPSNLPSRWASDKLQKILGWWNGQSGDIMRRMIAQVFPGLPTEAHMGFVANGGWTEDTAFSSSHAPFHELGGYGITGGPWDVPAPNTDTSKENDWYSLHADPDVRALLGGRDATMETFPRTASGRGLVIPLEDQIAIGVVSLKRKRDQANNRLDSRIQWQNPVSLWATALSFMGWSAGVPGATGHVNRFASQLASVPEEERWDAFLRALASSVQSGASQRGHTHRYAVYSAVRTQQKLMASRALSERIGGNSSFYGNPDPAAVDVIAQAASGAARAIVTTGGADESEHAIEAEGWTGTEIALGALAVVSVAAVGYIIYKRTRTPRRPNRRRRR